MAGLTSPIKQSFHRKSARQAPLATIRLNQVSKSFGLNSRSKRDSVLPRMRALTPHARPELSEEADRVHALDRVDLTVPDGQTMAVLGPSGCGKSTLLRVVSGLESDHSGDLFYNDVNMQDVPPKDRYIGMVFQNYALYPHFEGHGNLSFFFRMHKAPDEEIEERIRITSEIMGIGFRALLQRKPGTLSGGQQQRLAIARAIVRRPQVFLFDEPLSNLDAKLRAQTRVEIRRLLRRFAITALYVTHDQSEAMALGDQVAVMRAGKIEQVGPFTEVRLRPANTFVAGFLGVPPMNLLTGAEVSESRIVLESGMQIAPSPSIVETLQTGQELTVGIRPESVRVAVDDGGMGSAEMGEQPSTASILPGTVESVEADYGRQVQLVYILADGQRLVGQADMRARLAKGERIVAQLDPDALHIFDPHSGVRLE